MKTKNRTEKLRVRTLRLARRWWIWRYRNARGTFTAGADDRIPCIVRGLSELAYMDDPIRIDYQTLIGNRPHWVLDATIERKTFTPEPRNT